MLEQMGTRLPIYENYVQELTMTDEETVRLGGGTARRVGEGSCSRIRRALAYVYADLIQFCHDICAIFSKKRSRKLLSAFTQSYLVHAKNRTFRIFCKDPRFLHGRILEAV